MIPSEREICMRTEKPCHVIERMVMVANVSSFGTESSARTAFARHVYRTHTPVDRMLRVAAVLALAQSPALDVVGIGHADGRIVLHNLRVDRSVLTLSHEEGDACSSLAFRTDGVSVLVSAGGTSGALHVWHLEKRTRLSGRTAK